MDRPRATNASPAVFGVAYAALSVLEEAGEPGRRVRCAAASTRCARQAYDLAEHPVPHERVDERLALKTRSYDLMRAATTAAVVAGGGRAMGLDSRAQRLLRERDVPPRPGPDDRGAPRAPRRAGGRARRRGARGSPPATGHPRDVPARRGPVVVRGLPASSRTAPAPRARPARRPGAATGPARRAAAGRPRRTSTPPPGAGSRRARTRRCPAAWYSLIRSATSSWLPTSAVPAPPRTRPMPAHRLGWISRPSRSPPPCRASIRCCPSDSLRASPACTDPTVSGSKPVEQPVRLRPRLLGGVAGDDVQPDAEAQGAALARPRAPGSRRSSRRPAAGGSPQVRYTSTCLAATSPAIGEEPAEVDLGHRVGHPGQLRVLDLEVLAVQVDGLALPQPPHDLQELAGAAVAGVLVEEVAVGALLVALAAGDDVEQQPPAGLPLEGGRPSARRASARRSRAGRRPGTSAARCAG